MTNPEESTESTVEIFFRAISGKMQSKRKWEDLNFMEQEAFVQSVNTIIALCENPYENNSNFE